MSAPFGRTASRLGRRYANSWAKHCGWSAAFGNTIKMSGWPQYDGQGYNMAYGAEYTGLSTEAVLCNSMQCQAALSVAGGGGGTNADTMNWTNNDTATTIIAAQPGTGPYPPGDSRARLVLGYPVGFTATVSSGTDGGTMSITPNFQVTNGDPRSGTFPAVTPWFLRKGVWQFSYTGTCDQGEPYTSLYLISNISGAYTTAGGQGTVVVSNNTSLSWTKTVDLRAAPAWTGTVYFYFAGPYPAPYPNIFSATLTGTRISA